ALPDRLVLEKARAQLFLADLVLLERNRFERRQEAARLEQDEARGEPEERGRLFRGELAHRAHPLQVLRREVAEPDAEDVELLFLDELQEEIERTFESFDADARRADADDRRVVVLGRHGSASRSARCSSRSSSSVAVSWCRAIRRTTRSDSPRR